MLRKSFFSERNAIEIKELNSKVVFTARGLTEKIERLDSNQDSLEVRFRITPGRFFINVKKGTEASRKSFKHGNLISLEHPKTRGECYENSEIPLAMRAKAFSKLQNMREEEINFIGYSVQPSWGDRIKRVYPFVFLPEGIRLFAYGENYGGINVETYDESKRVKREGANIVVNLPSRTSKQPRYKIKLLNVPVIRNEKNLATILTLKPSIPVNEETGEPLSRDIPHRIYNIRYPYETDLEKSEIITFYPHDLAAYLAIAKEQNNKHNLTPMEMNPFALFSKHGAEFYKKLCNNIVIFDPTIDNPKNPKKLRKLHLDEKCILLGRGIARFGHDDFAYWDPARDGKLKDYCWK